MTAFVRVVGGFFAGLGRAVGVCLQAVGLWVIGFLLVAAVIVGVGLLLILGEGVGAALDYVLPPLLVGGFIAFYVFLGLILLAVVAAGLWLAGYVFYELPCWQLPSSE